MTLRSERLVAACGRPICDEASVFLDSCSTDQEYYDGAEATWLMWGAAHREKALAIAIFDKAFKRYRGTDVGCQLLAESASTASPARLNRIHATIGNYCRKNKEDQFARAAVLYVGWLLGQTSEESATKITSALERHSGDKAEFGTWLRTELTFEAWSRGVED